MKQVYVRGSKKSIEFNSLAVEFMNRTAGYVESKLTPGGFYTGVWCRDASYIIDELHQMGKYALVEDNLEWIWRHQIGEDIDFKCVHGRGSPEMNYGMQELVGNSAGGKNHIKSSIGALPTSIQSGYCEIYGQSPDIDSTGLIVSVTCKCCMENKQLANRLIPRLSNAISYLASRDLDGDHLLEQGPNEDWMDRMLRSGKLVYNQAIWIMALQNWAKLLKQYGYENEGEEAGKRADLVIDNVEKKLWSSQKGCYVDHQEENTQNGITQDVCFLLFAIKGRDYSNERVEKTLKTIENLLWKQNGSVCQEPPSKITSPPILGSYKYQNGGIWPWITATEIMSRLSYGQLRESQLLLERILPLAYLEWIDPNNIRSGGAFPFRTGIAAIRTALRMFLKTNKG